MDNLFLTVEEAAEKLNLNPETIRRRIRKGKLKAQLMPGPYGDQYMIPANELTTQDAQVATVPQLPIVMKEQFDLVLKKLDTLEERQRETEELLKAIYKRQDERITQAIPNREQNEKSWWKFWVKS